VEERTETVILSAAKGLALRIFKKRGRARSFAEFTLSEANGLRMTMA
jgi:hypothetical protein